MVYSIIHQIVIENCSQNCLETVSKIVPENYLINCPKTCLQIVPKTCLQIVPKSWVHKHCLLLRSNSVISILKQHINFFF